MQARRAIVLAALVLASVLPFARGFAAQGYISDSAQLDKIRQGSTTQQQVAEILGPPAWIERPQRGEVWDYWLTYGAKRVDVSIEFDDKGIVRGIQRTRMMGGP